MRAVAVVGASLAGVETARALREQGFDGRLTVVGDEDRLPYDRPPLSKEYLLGKAETDDLALLDGDDEDRLGIDWRLGVRATGLDLRRRAVELADGTEITADAVVVATGAAPNRLPGTAGLEGVHVLRSLTDADALRADLAAGSPRVAVIGGSFIGAEIASACSVLGLETTVVEALDTPMEPVLGPRVARVAAGLHGDNGVRLLRGVPVSGIRGIGRVTGVDLADGTVVPADVVVMGIGAKPATAWLEGSGLELDDGVVCDTGLLTAAGGVAAVGDVARLRGADGTSTRPEHWTAAAQQPAVAAANLLAGTALQEYRRAPYFWSDQYGVRLQFAGRAAPGDEVRVVEGALEEYAFAAVYERDGAVTAAAAMDRPRSFTRLRRGIGRAAAPV
ncbi:pyridine nucleotide-disulfide oxidoreductase [Streptomonospora alba]|uniref:Pyridine nucleotide-disulfide oxidoreductase n=1 Tax=Streptomonospora alba TaxID=183763 RepID=A0A0C2J7G1_9ACTN|nr:FAD-dependent oxidoreductase [Streptomonospora alba]KIH97366.1 pyridine nucleotide-disulfide oxidoreductase [Streptomonospora alba]